MDFTDQSQLFQSTADAYQAGMYNPVNPGVFNPGWGINPALLTPSYDAMYRPQYSGSSPYGFAGNPSFASSVNNIFGFAREPYWGNPIDSMQSSVRSMATKPYDFTVSAMQMVALPMAGYALGNRLLLPKPPANATGWRALNPFNIVGQAWRGEGFAAGLGSKFGGGLARGLGAGAGAARLASGVGGLAGLAGGFAAIQLGVEIADEAFIQSYKYSRANANALQDNTSNIYFGPGVGHPVSGKGLGGVTAARYGRALDRQALGDMMFEREDITAITQMSAKSGLLDNVDHSQITKRIKDVTEQIKLIVSISKDPNIQTAIEELAKLNMAGADVTGGRTSSAAKALSDINLYAGMSGMSVKKFMETSGAQGQYLFQSNGMTPYLGQLVAGNTMAGFASAQRMGLLSAGHLARMGGVEGATQASMTGELIGAQTPYNMLRVYNKYLGGGDTGSVVSNLSRFSAGFAGDPMSTMGAQILYGRGLAGKAMDEEGRTGLQDLAVQHLRMLNTYAKGDNGAFTAEQIAPVLKSMGMNDDQILTYISGRSVASERSSFEQKRQTALGSIAEQNRQYISQNLLYGGIMGRTYGGTVRAIRGVKDVAGGFGGAFAQLAGNAQDTISQWADSFNFGSSLTGPTMVKDIEDLVSPESSTVSKIHLGLNRSYKRDAGDYSSRDLFSKINSMASTSREAREYLNATTREGREAALAKLVAKHGKDMGEWGEALRSGGGKTIGQRQAMMDMVESALGKYSRDSTTINTASKEYVEFAQGAGKALGRSSDSNLVANLYDVGAANTLRRLVDTGDGTGLSPSAIAEKVRTDSRFAGILSAAGGSKSTNVSILDTIDRIVKESSRSGQATYGSGLDTFNAIKDPSKLSSMSKEEQSKFLRDIISKRGGLLQDQGLTDGTLSSSSVEQVLDLQNNSVNVARSLAKDVKAYLNKEVDYTTFRSRNKGIDSSDRMGLIVDLFGRHVDRFGAKGAGESTTEAVKSFFKQFEAPTADKITSSPGKK